jgi:hypothetical protein
MAYLECIFGRVADIELPSWLDKAQSEVGDFFQVNSRNNIQLSVVSWPSKALIDNISQPAIGSIGLHEALRKLIGSAANPVRRIGVLFADHYAPEPGAFGMMFDSGFVNLDGAGATNDPGPPREGCAVFLGAIKAARKHEAAGYTLQSLYTTRHELGHVFNLGHVEDKPNMMRTSHPTVTFPFTEWATLPFQVEHLSGGIHDEHVWPGGVKFEHLNSDRPWIASRSSGRELTLQISLPRKRMYCYEPIELDVEVRTRDSHGRYARIANVIDPGYEYFKIWVEEPNETRRIYRSPRHYCWQGQRRVVPANGCFRRDISIFGESGGYTFRRAGMHRIWVELMLAPGKRLSSNVVELECLARHFQDERRRALLTMPGSKAVFYHRVDPDAYQTLGQLEDFVADAPTDPAAPAIRYAVGRAYVAAAATRPERDALNARGKEHLERIAEAVNIGMHQRSLAAKITSELSRHQTRRRRR